MPATGTLSDPGLLRLARELRAAAWLSELSLYGLLIASVLAFGGVRPTAYVPMWWATLALVALLVWRAVLVVALRRRIGRTRFAFHPSGLWLVIEDDAPYGLTSWGFDLARPLLPSVPLLLPGALAVALALLQVIPLPPALLQRLTGGQAELLRQTPGEWLPVSVAEWSTRLGLVFLLMALGLHAVASSLFDRREARRRLERVLAGLGLLLSAIGLVQMAAGSREIYGLVKPRESDGGLVLFGPFVNRNHFAGYMLLIAPLAVGLLARAFSRYRERLGPRANARRVLVGLQSSEGLGMLYALVPAVACLAGLVASNSRSGVVALVGALALTGALQAKRKARRLLGPAAGAVVDGLLLVRAAAHALRPRGRRGLGPDPGLEGHAGAHGRLLAAGLGPQHLRRRHEPGDAVGAAQGSHPLARAPRGLPGQGPTHGLPGPRVHAGAGLVPRGPQRLPAGAGRDGRGRAAARAVGRVARAAFTAGTALVLFAAAVALLLQSLVEFSLQLPAVAALFVVVAACGSGRAAGADAAPSVPTSP